MKKMILILFGIVFLVSFVKLASAEDVCYLWDVRPGQQDSRVCSPSPPDCPDEIASYYSYSNCQCTDSDNWVFTACTYEQKFYSLLHPNDGNCTLSEDFVNVIADKYKCPRCGNRKIVANGYMSPQCNQQPLPHEQYTEQQCSDGIAALIDFDSVAFPCSKEPLCRIYSYYVEGDVTHKIYPEPCCSDQDQDSYATTQYNEVNCGALAVSDAEKRITGIGGDCWDGPGEDNTPEIQEQRRLANQVRRGCMFRIDATNLDFSEGYLQLLRDGEVEVAGFVEPEEIGKLENCSLQNHEDYNGDGWLPEQQLTCSERWPNGQSPAHTAEQEYPLPLKIAVEGSELACTVFGYTEPMKWGPTPLSNQYIHFELQQKDKPGDEWEEIFSKEIDLTSNSSIAKCSISGDDSYNDSLPFSCTWTMPNMIYSNRGKLVRCIAWPWVDNKDADYWKMKNKTSEQMGVAYRVSIWVPRSSKISSTQYILLNSLGPSFIGRTVAVRLPFALGGVHAEYHRIGAWPRGQAQNYLNRFSDAKSAVKWYDKQVFIEDNPPYLKPLTFELFPGEIAQFHTEGSNYTIERVNFDILRASDYFYLVKDFSWVKFNKWLDTQISVSTVPARVYEFYTKLFEDFSVTIPLPGYINQIA